MRIVTVEDRHQVHVMELNEVAAGLCECIKPLALIQWESRLGLGVFALGVEDWQWYEFRQ